MGRKMFCPSVGSTPNFGVDQAVNYFCFQNYSPLSATYVNALTIGNADSYIVSTKRESAFMFETERSVSINAQGSLTLPLDQSSWKRMLTSKLVQAISIARMLSLLKPC